jgi:hypothetical protein
MISRSCAVKKTRLGLPVLPVVCRVVNPLDVPLRDADKALGARGDFGSGAAGEALEIVPAPNAVDIDLPQGLCIKAAVLRGHSA